VKVRELIEKLKGVDQESQVIIQKDSEGNGYSPLYRIYNDCIYVPDSTWAGEVYSIDDYDDDEWKEIEKENERCLVLKPMN